MLQISIIKSRLYLCWYELGMAYQLPSPTKVSVLLLTCTGSGARLFLCWADFSMASLRDSAYFIIALSCESVSTQSRSSNRNISLDATTLQSLVWRDHTVHEVQHLVSFQLKVAIAQLISETAFNPQNMKGNQQTLWRVHFLQNY